MRRTGGTASPHVHGSDLVAVHDARCSAEQERMLAQCQAWREELKQAVEKCIGALPCRMLSTPAPTLTLRRVFQS